LSIKATTNSDGQYIITTVPYSNDGNLFVLTPMLGVHTFDPPSKPLFFSTNSVAHNNIDFVDKSSFKVSGKVYYEGGNYPVEGCSFSVDGKPAMRNNKLITSDANGEYQIEVPIGVHEVQVIKPGHNFINDGLALQNGQNINYNNDITGMNFQDQTRVKLIGHVVGGKLQDSIISGFGERKNNIGADVITLTATKGNMGFTLNTGAATHDTILHNQGEWIKPKGRTQDTTLMSVEGNNIIIHVSKSTGEYVAMVYPETYVIQNISAPGYGNIYEKLELLDLTKVAALNEQNMLEKSVRTWTDSTKRATQGNEVGDSILVTTSHADTVRFHKKWSFYYQARPTYTVKQLAAIGRDTVPVEYFGERSIIITEETTGIKDTVPLFTINSQNISYTFDNPVFKQGTPYMFQLKAFEIYTNQLTNKDDFVPLRGAEAHITSTIANSGNVTVKLDSIGQAVYRFMGGLPDLTSGLQYMSTTITIGNISYFSNLGSDGLDAYLLGDKSTGSDFMTTGPNHLITVLHDPPGSSSVAYMEKGVTSSHTLE
jgi:hypothetical protein